MEGGDEAFRRGGEVEVRHLPLYTDLGNGKDEAGRTKAQTSNEGERYMTRSAKASSVVGKNLDVSMQGRAHLTRYAMIFKMGLEG